jgi:hypothetical protein
MTPLKCVPPVDLGSDPDSELAGNCLRLGDLVTKHQLVFDFGTAKGNKRLCNRKQRFHLFPLVQCGYAAANLNVWILSRLINHQKQNYQ